MMGLQYFVIFDLIILLIKYLPITSKPQDTFRPAPCAPNRRHIFCGLAVSFQILFCILADTFRIAGGRYAAHGALKAQEAYRRSVTELNSVP
jgi:hypothetical protein